MNAPEPELPAGHEGPAAPAPAPAIVLNHLGWADPLRWLLAGWRDFTRAPLIGLFYGSAFMVMGWALLKVYEHAPAYTLALSAGRRSSGSWLFEQRLLPSVSVMLIIVICGSRTPSRSM